MRNHFVNYLPRKFQSQVKHAMNLKTLYLFWYSLFCNFFRIFILASQSSRGLFSEMAVNIDYGNIENGNIKNGTPKWGTKSKI